MRSYPHRGDHFFGCVLDRDGDRRASKHELLMTHREAVAPHPLELLAQPLPARDRVRPPTFQPPTVEQLGRLKPRGGHHHPVFVLTHHAREPLKMIGGTTFHFVTHGIESALAQAKDMAQGQDVWLAGGASVINQYLAAGLVAEVDISIAPMVMAGGERLFEGLQRGALKLKQIRAVDAPGVTHIKYQVG